MKLDDSLEAALNQQIAMEFAASHSYLSMAAYFEREAWDGFTVWMTLQSEEERAHAMKFYQYILDRGGKVELHAIEAPRVGFESPLDVFEKSYAQEQKVSESIYDLYKLANDAADFATVSFLKFFVDEQVEEEKNVSDMIDKIKRAEGNPDAMLQLDRLAGERQPEAE